MLKKILIGIGIFLLLVVAAMFYLNNRNRTLSPPGSTEITNEGLSVKVDYSRPSVRGRNIFDGDEPLLKQGKYWRLGANEPTLLTVNKDFTFNDLPIKAGAYDMYALPGTGEIEIRLNTGGRFWGATEPDYNQDVLKTTVPIETTTVSVEQFTITAVAEGADVKLVMMWANKMWSVRIAGD
jgi:hypothetical protein